MGRAKTISFGATELERRGLEQLVTQFHYRNRSHAISAALVLLFEKHGMKAEAIAELRSGRKHGRRRRVYRPTA